MARAKRFKQVMTALPPSTIALIDSHCEKVERPRSVFLRQIIMAYVKQNLKPKESSDAAIEKV